MIFCINVCALGSLSEEGLLVYLRVLQAFLSQLPVSAAGANCQDANSDSEDEDEEISKMTTTPVSRQNSCEWICTAVAAKIGKNRSLFAS